MADEKKGPKKQQELLDWFTISYRTIYLASGLVVVVVGLVLYLLFGAKPTPPPPVETAPASATTARFTSLEGTVKVKAVGTFEWVTATKSITLKKSDLVRTAPGSAAEITFFDGTVVHVRPDSLISIEETSEDPSTKRRKVAWHISSGEVNFQTVQYNVPGSATEVSTPTVKGTVSENAAAAIRVADTGSSDIRMFRGTSQLETKSGERVAVSTNEGLKVDAGGNAGPKVVLPGIPTLERPLHQSEVTADAGAALTLQWKPVPNAASYHVMLDFSAVFSRPLVDRKGIRAAAQEVRGLEEGKYYWRVAALDKDGNEGAFSDFAGFTLARGPTGAAAPPPPLRIDALDVRGNILQIKGRTEPGASLTLNGQRLEVQPDGSFNEFISLELGKQTIVIRAVGLNGGINEQRRNVEAKY